MSGHAAPAGAAEIVLVTGGARSGKSAFAERLAAEPGQPVLYVATAAAGDAEMAARIAAHRARRPATWRTVEAPLRPAAHLRAALDSERTVLLDCAGMWVANMLLDIGDWADPGPALRRELDALLGLAEEQQLRLIVVSAEVGLGLLPLTALGRRYVDALGDVNQQLAAAAARCYLVVAGLGVDLRKLAERLNGPECAP